MQPMGSHIAAATWCLSELYLLMQLMGSKHGKRQQKPRRLLAYSQFPFVTLRWKLRRARSSLVMT